MFKISSEVLLYSGISLVALSAIFAIASTIYFKITGNKLKKTLEQEYGKDVQNNSRDI